jgi:hypothetical protein
MPLGPGAPNPSGLPGFHAHYGVSARPGGGNSNATQLNGWLNTVTAVATANDSVMLPPGYAGMEITIINNGANSCTVFGYMNTSPGDIVTDTIAPPASIVQGVAGVPVASGAVGVFFCMTGQGAMTNGIAPAMWRAKILT